MASYKIKLKKIDFSLKDDDFTNGESVSFSVGYSGRHMSDDLWGPHRWRGIFIRRDVYFTARCR